MQANDTKTVSGTAARRAIILTLLIVAVTFFWVLILLYTNLPTFALAGVGLLSLLVLAVATAWTAMAFPGRSDRPARNSEYPRCPALSRSDHEWSRLSDLSVQPGCQCWPLAPLPSASYREIRNPRFFDSLRPFGLVVRSLDECKTHGINHPGRRIHSR